MSPFRMTKGRPLVRFAMMAILAIIGLVGAFAISAAARPAETPPPSNVPSAPSPAPAETVNSNVPARPAEDLLKSVVLIDVKWQAQSANQPQPAAPAGLPSFASPQPPLTYEGLCSGFFESTDGLIASAGHCVDENDAKLALQEEAATQSATGQPPTLGGMTASQPLPQISEPQLTITVVQPKGITDACVIEPHPAYLLDSRPSDRGDDAFLKLDDLPCATVPLPLAASAPRLGDTVHALGFVGGQFDDLLRASNPGVTAPQSSLLDEIVKRPFTASYTGGTVSAHSLQNGVGMTEVDTDMTFGMSGGPALNDHNEVVGVISGGTPSMGGNFNYITPLDRLRSDLAREGADPTTAQPPNSGPQSSQSQSSQDITPAVVSQQFDNSASWVRAAIFGAIGLLIGICLGVIGARRYYPRRTEALEPDRPTVDEHHHPEGDDENGETENSPAAAEDEPKTPRRLKLLKSIRAGRRPTSRRPSATDQPAGAR